jgi:4-amino-4-deoxy-L-arabinose transferase-like glycosyltransferase
VVALLLALGLVARLGLLWQTRDTALVVSDEHDYYSLALNLARGNGFAFEPGRLTSMRPPLYPAFIAGLFVVTGSESPQLVRSVQVLVSALLALGTFALGRKLFGSTTGAVAGLIVWLYPSFLLANLLLLTELQFALLLVLAALAFAGVFERPTPMRGVALGLAIGCAALTRSVLWPFPLVLVPMLLVWGPGSLRARTAVVIGVLAGYGLVVGPWAVRNTRLQHVPVVVDTMGGMNLRIGNYEYTPDDRMWSAAFDYKDEKSWSAALATEHPEATGWTDGQKEKWAQRKAVQFIVAHPLLTARRCAIRFADFWGLEREFVALVRDGKYQVPAWFGIVGAAATLLTFPVLILLAVYGTLAAVPADKPTAGFVVLLTVFVCGLHCLVFAHSRYRLPLTPFFAVFAAAVLVQRPHAGSLPAWRRLAVWGLGLALVLIWGRQVAFNDLPRALDFLRKVRGA